MQDEQASRRTSLWRTILLLGCPLDEAEDVLLKTHLDDPPDLRLLVDRVHAALDAPRDAVSWTEGAPRDADGLGALADQEREVVVLRHHLGLDAAETGGALGLPAGTVEALEAQALTRIGTDPQGVRDLCRLAADELPPPPPERRSVGRSPRLVAGVIGAAALIALLVVTSLVVGRRGSGPTADPTVQPQAASASDRSGTTDLGGPRIPAVLGYTGPEARRLLARRGLAVTVETAISCAVPTGAAVGTRPVGGSPVTPGLRVRLQVADDAASCPADPAQQRGYQLLRFARGLSPGPRFAPRVTIYHDPRAGGSRVLSASQARDPSTWGYCYGPTPGCTSPLDTLVAAVSDPVLGEGGVYISPRLVAATGRPSQTGPCAFTPAPAALSGRSGLLLSTSFPVHGPFCTAIGEVDVYRDGQDRIDAVSLRLPAATRSAQTDQATAAVVPGVLRLSVARAVARVDRAGFSVRLETSVQSTCLDHRLVLGQAPGRGAQRPTGSTVTLIVSRTERTGCPT